MLVFEMFVFLFEVFVLFIIDYLSDSIGEMIVFCRRIVSCWDVYGFDLDYLVGI